MNQQLLGHLLGALDDDEEQWLETRLEQDEERRRGLARWRQRLAPLEKMRPEFEPPRGLAERTCRLVAAFGPAPVRRFEPSMTMSPELTPSIRPVQFGWPDVAAVGILLMTALFLALPAIDGSRFHARLAACQNGLRQVGLALTDYSACSGTPLPQLAHGGRLTNAGLAAVDSLREELGPEAAGIGSDAWLAAQRETQGIPRVAAVSLPALPTSNRVGDWPGMWRNGNSNDVGDLLPTTEALLADAPSALVPGQPVEYHGGRGRNFFFADGHVEFVGTLPGEATGQALPPPSPSFRTDGRLPIVFVGGR